MGWWGGGGGDIPLFSSYMYMTSHQAQAVRYQLCALQLKETIVKCFGALKGGGGALNSFSPDGGFSLITFVF